VADEQASARDIALALLAVRAPGATICPSEVARALAAEADAGPTEAAWRDVMPIVHAAVDSLLIEDLVRLSWRGKTLTTRAGPYRIGRGVSG
jgi:hypothetical protein